MLFRFTLGWDDILGITTNPKEELIMATPTRFARQELKYMVTEQQQLQLMTLMQSYMTPDRFGRSTICNLYFDTPSYLIIRRSMQKPVYKEKLRLRSYGVADNDSKVYIELKKKYKGIVYKRREAMTYHHARSWLLEDATASLCGQVIDEIEYFRKLYTDLAPRMFISSEREAFFAKGECDLRMTFDSNILWRATDLVLDKPVYGSPILRADQRLLEVKSSLGMPEWLSHFLSENGIFKTSFSKYGNAYVAMQVQQQSGGQISA